MFQEQRYVSANTNKRGIKLVPAMYLKAISKADCSFGPGEVASGSTSRCCNRKHHHLLLQELLEWRQLQQLHHTLQHQLLQTGCSCLSATVVFVMPPFCSIHYSLALQKRVAFVRIQLTTLFLCPYGPSFPLHSERKAAN